MKSGEICKDCGRSYSIHNFDCGKCYGRESIILYNPSEGRPTMDSTAKTSGEGLKFDSNKPDLTDIPLEALWQMGEAFTYGQRKYAKSNFRKGMLASRQLAAAVRHIFQHLAGQTLDAESGVTHLGHALASIAMACYTLANHPHLDDRYEGDLAKNNNSVVKAT